MPCALQVMDMTATSFSDGAFGVVFDKGGLDALMGEDDDGAGEAGRKLLQEVSRLLRPEGGTYICVTLAQQHVLRALAALSDVHFAPVTLTLLKAQSLKLIPGLRKDVLSVVYLTHNS